MHCCTVLRFQTTIHYNDFGIKALGILCDDDDDEDDNDDDDDEDDDDEDDDEEQSVGGVVHHVVEGHRLGTVCHRFRHNIPSREGPSS